MIPIEMRRLLCAEGLPTDMEIAVEDSEEFDGRYFPATDQLKVRPTAGRFTVLHEGAHAEHWGKLNLRKVQSERSLAFDIGALLASEVYVGRRLGSVEGYLQHEWASLQKIDGFPDRFEDLADRFMTRDDFGVDGAGRFLRTLAVAFLVRTLPLLGAESSTSSFKFFDGLNVSASYPGLLCSVALKLKEMPIESLTARSALEEFGTWVLGEFSKAGVVVVSAV